jgi:hypothetical protein
MGSKIELSIQNLTINFAPVGASAGEPRQGQAAVFASHLGCAPLPGELWQGQGGRNAGLIIPSDGSRPYYVIAAEHPDGQIAEIAWGGYGKDEPGARSHWDGMANTIALVESEHDHPAAEWAKGLTLDGHSDFYLPARRELALVEICMADRFPKGWHLTSTQYSPLSAYGQTFGDGYTITIFKDYEVRALAVRRLFI